MNAAALPDTPAKGLLSRLARRPLATLFLLCLVAWVPGFFTMPPLDRDESRFAQASRQMVESGDYVDIRFSTASRYRKPVGIYWMQSASTLLFGKPPYDAIWTYRVPSLIGAFLAVVFAFWCMRAFAPPETALIGAAFVGLTVSLRAEALIAKTDAVLLATILGAQAVLVRAYLAARMPGRAPPTLGMALAGWAAFGIGILVKGPVIAAVLALGICAISIWDRDWRWLRSLHWGPGLALAILICLPWAIAIAFVSHGQFYEQALGHDFAAKVMGGQETHGAPPGYYLLLASLTLWPATLVAVPGIGSAIADRRNPAVRYLLAWAGAAWLMFELVPTKLPHYILPAYPAVVFLGALWAMRAPPADEPRWAKVLRIIAAVQFAAALLALALAPVLAPHYFGSGTTWWLVAGAVAGMAPGIGAIVLLLQRKNLAACMSAACAALIFFPLLCWGVPGHLDRIWVSPRAAALVARNRHPGDPPVVLSGYVEPSLVFLLGTGTLLEPPKDAGTTAARQGGLALVEDRSRPVFLARLTELGATAKPVDQLSGINYSRGRKVHITLYRVTPGR